MKRYLIIGFSIAIICCAIFESMPFVLAQDNKPVIYRLSSEKSLEFAKGEAAKRELERQWHEVDMQQKLIMAVSQIPESELDRKPVVEGDHYAFYPKAEIKKP